MSSFSIRPAIQTDLGSLVQLENTIFRHDKISTRSFRQFLKKKYHCIFVAETNSSLIACSILLLRKNSLCARIYSLAVGKEYRRFGIAEKLCLAMEKEARKAKCKFLTLEVRHDNPPAIAFYKKHGYEIIGTHQGYYEDGMDAIRMKKELICPPR